jgi:AraC family transcriptional regulator
MVRMFEGRFGRLVLHDLRASEPIEAPTDPAIILAARDAAVRFLNPGEIHICLDASRVLVLHAAGDWLHQSFPAVFRAGEARPFPDPCEPITPRIRQLADTLTVEALNDRFLSTGRLEFMLQELVLSIVETYLGRRRSTSLWRGSRFEDGRIRRAIALLRERPNKDQSIDDLASQVGLSRSRFYDLFQVCTGFSPRTYLDMLCIEAAIARLCSGRGKISEVSAALGFSAQSNFTRFFQQQVGVPPSRYRRSASESDAAAPAPGAAPARD